MPRNRLKEALHELHESNNTMADYSELLRLADAFLQIDNPVRRLRTLHFVEDIAARRQSPPVLAVL